MNYNNQWFIKTGVLLGLALLSQILGLSYLASILFNTILFTSALLVGTLGGSLIATLTPIIALKLGFLPTALSSLLPFIIGANIALIVIYTYLKDKDKLLSIGIATFIRFTILSSGVRYLSELPEEIANMMQVSQLATSLAGGLLSLLVVVLLIKIDNDRLKILPNQ